MDGELLLIIYYIYFYCYFNEQGVEFLSVFDQHFFPIEKPILTFLLNGWLYLSEKCRLFLISQCLVGISFIYDNIKA